MTVLQTALPGVLLIEPPVFEDPRGSFFELWRADRAAECGVGKPFVQDNVSVSRRGVVRGLHYQLRHPQAKLVTVLDGEVYDVAVDVRTGSPTFGRWTAARLSGENRRQMYVPEGFAHGFAVTSERALVLYKCSSHYAPDDQQAVLWNDPALGIDWPVEAAILSDKDGAAPTLADSGTRGLLPVS